MLHDPSLLHIVHIIASAMYSALVWGAVCVKISACACMRCPPANAGYDLYPVARLPPGIDRQEVTEQRARTPVLAVLYVRTCIKSAGTVQIDSGWTSQGRSRSHCAVLPFKQQSVSVYLSSFLPAIFSSSIVSLIYC